MNQGGIEDKYIDGKKNPILKLADLDGDNDLDLLYGSQTEFINDIGYTEHEVIKLSKLTAHRYESDEKRMLRVDREAKTEGSLSNFAIGTISDMQVGKLNDDNFIDVVINTYNTNGEKELNVYFGKENTKSTKRKQKSHKKP